MANYYENLGELGFDNISNGVGVPVITALRTIRKVAANEVLKRGTALALSGGTGGDGKLVILGTTAADNETLAANCILAEDVEVGTSVDANAVVYLSGHFNRNMLPVKDGYTTNATDVEAFRAAGIFLDNSMK